MKPEKLIRVAYQADGTIEVLSDFSKHESYRRLILAGLGVEHKFKRIVFRRYKKT